jgi:hypothetical protein
VGREGEGLALGLPLDGLVVAVLVGGLQAFDDGRYPIGLGLGAHLIEFVPEGLGG